MKTVRKGVSGGRSATLKDGRGKKLCAIRTNKDRTGTFEPPCKGHAECGRRQHEAKLPRKKKHPPFRQDNNKEDVEQKRKLTL